MAVVGCGYAGLHTIRSFVGGKRQVRVIGYDVNVRRVNELNECNTSGAVEYTFDRRRLEEARAFFICVPTPVVKKGGAWTPDYSFVDAAVATVAAVATKGALVVLCSTVGPGVTERCFEPLKDKGVYLGYSPERFSPGWLTASGARLIAGVDSQSLGALSALYDALGVRYKAVSSVKVAELSKLLENAKRDVNVALLNEFRRISALAGVSMTEVLEAAESKFNFNDGKFYPGLVGGHCVPVDPLLLADVYPSELISAVRRVNDAAYKHLARWVVDEVARLGVVDVKRVLVLGAAFKPNVADVRNSGAVNLAVELGTLFRDAAVDVVDPLVGDRTVVSGVGPAVRVSAAVVLDRAYDVAVLAVPHSVFTEDPDCQRFLLQRARVVLDLGRQDFALGNSMTGFNGDGENGGE